MIRILMMLGFAAGLFASPLRLATCSLMDTGAYPEYNATTTTVTGASSCTLGDWPAGPGPFAHAENTLEIVPHTGVDRSSIMVSAAAFYHNVVFPEQDREVTASASSLVDYTFIATTPGPVRPGFLFVEGSSNREASQPTITVGDVNVLMGPTFCDAEGCYSTGHQPHAPFTLGAPFAVTIHADVSVPPAPAYSPYFNSYFDRTAAINIWFTETENPCSEFGDYCNPSVGGFDIVPEPSSAFLVLASAALLLAMPIARKRITFLRR
jgi:hypothetical protein